MKHTLRTWIAVLLSLCLCLSLAGCGGGGSGSGNAPSGHTHTFAAEWSNDENGHWHAATCDHTSERKDEAAHTYKNGKCTACGYEHEEHSFGTYEKTETGHSRTCSVCGKTVTAAHTYENSFCGECGYEHGNHTFGAYDKTEAEHSQTCPDCGKTVTAAHTYENGKCNICGYAHREHSFGEYTRTETEHTQTCSVCGKIVSEEHTYEKGQCKICGYAHKQHTFSGGVCTVCGAEKPVYYFSEDKSKVYFGEYPQTRVDDAATTAALTEAAGTLPSAANRGKWTSYGYYIKKNISDHMWYIDLPYDGAKYRGIYFTEYRPQNAAMGEGESNSQQSKNGYVTGVVYWFRYETIEWRVLEQKNGTALLFANVILDSQQYYHLEDDRMIGAKTVYANNYAESDIRRWLNGTFLQTAFDQASAAIVKTSTVDNSAATASEGSKDFVCETTQDKVFLLSLSEVTSSVYGFADGDEKNDPARRLSPTDYAKSQGIFAPSYSTAIWYWLRSPASSKLYAYYASGPANDSMLVQHTQVGVAPALRITL